MKVTSLEKFHDLVAELGILIAPADVDRLYAALVPPESTHTFIAAYCEAYKPRYKTNPVMDGVASGTAKRLVKDLGVAKAVALVECYLKMNDSFFIARRHNLMTFAQNLNAVQVFLDTHKTVTQTELRQQDRRQANINAFGDLLEESRAQHQAAQSGSHSDSHGHD